MSILDVIATAALIAVVAPAQDLERSSRQSVTVCLNPAADLTVFRAREITSRIFAGIGVRVNWKADARLCAASGDGIAITLSYRTPKDQQPGALAYAMPFQGTQVEVFYDRVRATVPPAETPSLLAHVLAHEIAHMLQGVARHSATGIMKDHWDEDECLEMLRKPLAFSDFDVILIHDGLDSRNSHGKQDARTAEMTPESRVP